MMEFPTVPGYTVHQLLGKGGMAAVYLATQESLHRQVAIKILTDFGDEKAEQRFFTEARTVAALHHPHIVIVHDVARLEDGKPYIVMEYLSGGDLTRLKGQTLGEVQALDLIRQVAEALSAVHQKGIIHRDVKPANILFRSDDTVALSDFGIAKDTAINTELTMAGLSVGSPAYSSPEQIYGETLDPRSDIYSLGVVLLELLTGNNPFKGSSYAETVVNHTEKPVPDLTPISRNCQQLLTKMLTKNPDDRYPTVDALLQDLRRISHPQSEDVTTMRATAPNTVAMRQQRVIGLLKQYKWPVGIVTGILLAVVLFFSLHETKRDKQIAALLKQAEGKIATDNLIAPEFENARYFYNQVLTIDPGNDDAQDGLEHINELLVKRYLTLAAERLEQKRLDTPSGDNSVFYYRQVLAIDGDNQVAKEGLEHVVQMYKDMADEAFNKREFGRGLMYVHAGLDIEPDNAQLKSMQEKYKGKGNLLRRFFNRIMK